MNPERFGNYVLVQRLGKGGMAEVFLARAQSLGGFEKLLAIKRLLPPYNADQQIISMLGDEARLSVWLNHPNIVQVLDFGRVGQTYYIAMEYVQGCDLCDLIRPNGQMPGRPLPLSTALYALLQVAEALDYAHTRKNRRGEPLGIIHRDVSPHNVLISSEGQVKLADFGLARANISVHFSAAGVIRGKFSYMPKEQARGKSIDHRIDLFAAGVTLYEALTGLKPFTSTTLAQQISQLDKPIPPPSSHQPDIPEEIDDIVMQAMSPDPETRYATAEDLASDLRDALSKYSNVNKEAERLSALVRKSIVQPPLAPARLPFMSLADLHVPDDSLIGDELRAVQRDIKTTGGPPVQSTIKSLAATPSPESDAEDEGYTAQFEQAGQDLPTLEQSIEELKTVAISPNTVLPSARQAAIVANHSTAPEPTRTARGSAPHGQQVAAERSLSTSPEPLRRAPPAAGTLDVPPAKEFAPAATAGEILATTSTEAPHDQLEAARTVQQGPEAALSSFRRALEERELRTAPQEKTENTSRRFRWAVGMTAGGLMLLGLGVVLGSLIARPSQPLNTPLKKACIEPSACPPCVVPLPPQTDAGPAVALAQPARVDSSVDVFSTINVPVSPSALDAGTAQLFIRRQLRHVNRRPAIRKARGFLNVNTGGVPARVYIDDRTHSLAAPLVRFPLAPGSHRVRIYSEQHKTFSDPQLVNIAAGQTATLFFNLR